MWSKSRITSTYYATTKSQTHSTREQHRLIVSLYLSSWIGSAETTARPMRLSSDAVSNTEKCFGVFARLSARQSGDRERACVYTCVVFFILGLSLFLFPDSPSPPPPPTFQCRGTRQGRFISTVAIVLFVSQPALHASRRRVFSPTFSIYLLANRLSFSPPVPAPSLLCHPCAPLHCRSVRWTNRLDVISTYPRVRV